MQVLQQRQTQQDDAQVDAEHDRRGAQGWEVTAEQQGKGIHTARRAAAAKGEGAARADQQAAKGCRPQRVPCGIKAALRKEQHGKRIDQGREERARGKGMAKRPPADKRESPATPPVTSACGSKNTTVPKPSSSVP